MLRQTQFHLINFSKVFIIIIIIIKKTYNEKRMNLKSLVFHCLFLLLEALMQRITLKTLFILDIQLGWIKIIWVTLVFDFWCWNKCWVNPQSKKNLYDLKPKWKVEEHWVEYDAWRGSCFITALLCAGLVFQQALKVWHWSTITGIRELKPKQLMGLHNELLFNYSCYIPE